VDTYFLLNFKLERVTNYDSINHIMSKYFDAKFCNLFVEQNSTAITFV